MLTRGIRTARMILTIPLHFGLSLQEDSPRDLESAVNSVVFERRVVLELIIEAEPGTLADWTKIPEVELGCLARSRDRR